jgi:hypothetical protein
MWVVAGLRFAAIRWNLRLPVFRVPDEELATDAADARSGSKKENKVYK